MKKIKIGAIIFKIKVMKFTDTNMGAVSYNKSMIRIRKGLDKQIEKETLLHEILHIALVQTGHNDKTDEGVIDAIAYTLLNIPGLINLDGFLDNK